MPDAPNAVQTEPDAELLRALAAFPDEVTRLLDGRPDGELRQPGSDGGWGVVEHLCHLRDWEAVVRDRTRSIAARDRPEIAEVDVGLWDVERTYRDQDPQQALDGFRALRMETVERFAALPAAGWDRTGRHPTYGPLSLRWIAGQTRDHDAEHLAQMRDVLG